MQIISTRRIQKKSVFYKILELLFSIFAGTAVFSNRSLAQVSCTLDLINPRFQLLMNKDFNQNLKDHQIISKLEIVIQGLTLDEVSNQNLRVQSNIQASSQSSLIINMITKNGGKSFSAVYTIATILNHWKLDLSKSQIFPSIAKSYAQLIFYNNKYLLRLYDDPGSDKKIRQVYFEKSQDCHKTLSIGEKRYLKKEST